MRVVLVLVILGSTLTLFPAPAYACSCDVSTLAERADELDFAFVGTQIERELLDEFEDNGVRLVFEVNRVYKGNVTTPFEVFTDAQGCGVTFEKDVVTAVVGSEWQGKANVNQCDQLLESSDEALTAAFGTRVAPTPVPLEEPEADESPPWFWLLVPAFLGSAAAVVVVAKRSREIDG